MADILFSMVPEHGHLYPTFKVARGLEAAGHRVAYLALKDFEREVIAQGFRLEPLFEDLYPRGALEEQRQRMAQAGSEQEMIALIKEEAHLSRTFQSRWLDGSAERLLEGLGPDLVIADTLEPLMALTAHGLGIPSLMLNPILPFDRAPFVPPATSRTVPTGRGWGERLKIEWEWQKLRVCKAAMKFRMNLHRMNGHLPGLLEELVAKVRLEAGRVEPHSPFKPTLRPSPALPEVILSPRRLDFPRPQMVGREYAEASIDLERDEPPFPWQQLDEGKRLIFCSFGSQTHRMSGLTALYEAAVEAVRRREDLQLVVQVGGVLEAEHFEPLPENILVCNTVSAPAMAPQLALLERADLAIIAGGIGTVKECLYLGVPMIVFPQIRDQFGVAARVAFRHLGLLGDNRAAEAAGMRALIDRALASKHMRDEISSIREEIQQLEAEQPSLRWIERRLRNEKF